MTGCRDSSNRRRRSKGATVGRIGRLGRCLSILVVLHEPQPSHHLLLPLAGRRSRLIAGLDETESHRPLPNKRLLLLRVRRARPTRVGRIEWELVRRCAQREGRLDRRERAAVLDGAGRLLVRRRGRGRRVKRAAVSGRVGSRRQSSVCRLFELLARRVVHDRSTCRSLRVLQTGRDLRRRRTGRPSVAQLRRRGRVGWTERRPERVEMDRGQVESGRGWPDR